MNVRVEIIYVLVFWFWLHLTNSSQLKIIGGSPIGISSKPYMVSIHKINTGLLCGGTILSSRWIISAFHCFDGKNDITGYYVRAGSTISHGGTTRSIIGLKIFNDTMHKDIPYLPYHDIILIKIAPRFSFYQNIQSLKLPKLNEKAPNQLWVSGWGLSRDEIHHKYLKTVRVDKVAYEKCIEVVSVYREIIDNSTQMCYGKKNHDSCYGDSGGPLASHKKIYGIVSFGIDCGVYPGVYVKVSHYTKWIQKIISSKSSRRNGV